MALTIVSPKSDKSRQVLMIDIDDISCVFQDKSKIDKYILLLKSNECRVELNREMIDLLISHSESN